jgi:maleylacetoacetate isomerase
MKLYGYFRSSSAWRVRIALEYKGIACERVYVRLRKEAGEQHSAEFLRVSPLGQVPVLEIPSEQGVSTITQSIAILEYLEETHPDPPLLPRDPAIRARVREMAEVINSGIQPLQNLKLQSELGARGVDALPITRTYIEEGLRALEILARPVAGRFLVGDTVTFADVCLVPQLAAARRLGVSPEKLELLCRVERQCAELPAFRAASPDAQPDREALPT